MWTPTTKGDARACALADRHYSRQTRGGRQFMPPGKTLVLLTSDARAVWGVCWNKDPRGGKQFRCTIFRNESAMLSSTLIVEATTLSQAWARSKGITEPLRTTVDPKRVRRKRDPGRCFLRAGWRVVGHAKGHRHRNAIVLEAPKEEA